MDDLLYFVIQAQLTKALSFSCCVEVYQPWSSKSLVEVASQCLKSSPHKSEPHHPTLTCCTLTLVLLLSRLHQMILHLFVFSHYVVERGGLEVSLPVAMAGIHQSARQYASVLLQAQPFSPQTYMEFIAHFGYLCGHLHKQQQSRAHR